MPKRKPKVTPPGPGGGGSVHKLVAMTPCPGGLVLKGLNPEVLVSNWNKIVNGCIQEILMETL